MRVSVRVHADEYADGIVFWIEFLETEDEVELVVPFTLFQCLDDQTLV